MQTLSLLVLLAALVFPCSGFPSLGTYLAHIFFPNEPYFPPSIPPWIGRPVSTRASFAAPPRPNMLPMNSLLELSTTPAPSPMVQGSEPAPITGCKSLCEPLFSVIVNSHCRCVLLMEVKLLFDAPYYLLSNEIPELVTEVAAVTYLNRSQVLIEVFAPDTDYQDKTVVIIRLVPRGLKFDKATVKSIYERFRQGKVHFNTSLFNNYKLVQFNSPGLPLLPSPPPPPGVPLYPRSAPLPPSFTDKHHKINPIIFVIALSTLVFLMISCGVVAILLKPWKAGQPSNGGSVVPGTGSVFSDSSESSSSRRTIPSSVFPVKTFSRAELEKATRNFSRKNVLGEGGFGRVYKGTLDDGSEVAVKLLRRDVRYRGREFLAEIDMQSRLHHRNLVKLIGVCAEGSTRCLVYELIRNGSIESHLHGADKEKGALNWDTRLKIALGAARGLAYLHEDSSPRVIHRDFKSGNVLLENDFTPKVSDFGLARVAKAGNSHISTRVMGTFGYVAPEYAMTGHLLVKSDVYSYGIVLLELLSGRKSVDMASPPGEEVLVTWARPLLLTREGLKQVVDPALEASGNFSFDDLAKVAAIASKCVELDVANRPYMGEVVQALKLVYNDAGDSLGNSNSSSQKESNGLNIGFTTSSVTVDFSSGPLEEGRRKERGRWLPRNYYMVDGVLLPVRLDNWSGPLTSIGSKPLFNGWEVTVSERGHEAPF